MQGSRYAVSLEPARRRNVQRNVTASARLGGRLLFAIRRELDVQHVPNMSGLIAGRIALPSSAHIIRAMDPSDSFAARLQARQNPGLDSSISAVDARISRTLCIVAIQPPRAQAAVPYIYAAASEANIRFCRRSIGQEAWITRIGSRSAKLGDYAGLVSLSYTVQRIDRRWPMRWFLLLPDNGRPDLVVLARMHRGGPVAPLTLRARRTRCRCHRLLSCGTI